MCLRYLHFIITSLQRNQHPHLLTEICKIHTDILDLKSKKPHWNLLLKNANIKYQCRVTLVTRQKAAFARCQTHNPSKQTETIPSVQEFSTKATLHCLVSPMIQPTCLHIDNLPNRFTQDSQMTTLEKPTSSHTSPTSQVPHFGKKARSAEARQFYQAK